MKYEASVHTRHALEKQKQVQKYVKLSLQCFIYFLLLK